MKNENLSRLIKYCGGGLGIELHQGDLYKTIYVNTEGKEEFALDRKVPVLPMDKILYYKTVDIPLTKDQEERLNKILDNAEDKKIIRRLGDENILVELKGEVISITPIGWELPFESINHIECSEDEIYLIPNREVLKEVPEDTVKIAKVGDYVQATNGKKLIEGELFSEYNAGDTFNIIFENGTKHTAIPRVAIKKILKSA